MEILGNDIRSCRGHFEQVRLLDKYLFEYFIEYDDIVRILKLFRFEKTKKRTRTWLTPILPSRKNIYGDL